MRCEFQHKPKQQLVWLSSASHPPHARHAHFWKVHTKVPPFVIPAGNLLSLRVWTGQENRRPPHTPVLWLSPAEQHQVEPISHVSGFKASIGTAFSVCDECRKATVSWCNHRLVCLWASAWTWCLIVRFITERKTDRVTVGTQVIIAF